MKINKTELKENLLLALILGLVILIASLDTRAEGLYLSVGAGENRQIFSSHNNWDDGGGTGAYIGLFYKWDKQSWCFNCYPSINYVHLSQWDAGCPQNCDKYEDSVDHIGLAATWEIYKKD